MPAGNRVRSNSEFGLTTDAPLTAGATTFNSARLALMPVVSSAHAVVTLDPRAINGEPEIVIMTAHTAAATVATITRAAYGTAARSHPAGTEWIHAPVDEDFIEILTSSTRPSDPYGGQLIFETDTDKYVARIAANTGWMDALPLGAWTSYIPTLTQSVTVTKSVNFARWTRFGRTIHVNMRLAVTSSGTAGQILRIGLPVVGAGGFGYSVGNGIIFDLSANTMYNGTAMIASPGDNVELYVDATGATPWGSVPSVAIANTDLIMISVTYEAAS